MGLEAFSSKMIATNECIKFNLNKLCDSIIHLGLAEKLATVVVGFPPHVFGEIC